jgi:hypothetical protein
MDLPTIIERDKNEQKTKSLKKYSSFFSFLLYLPAPIFQTETTTATKNM